MALDPRTGVYIFDDQPELDKLRGWYDQVRNGIEEASDAEHPEQRGRRDEDPLTRRASCSSP